MPDPHPTPPADPTPPPADPIVGIDLGTTNSLVAHCTAAGPRLIAGPDGRTSLPSVVQIDPNTGHTAAVGHAARDAAAQQPANTLASFKRLMGRSPQDLADDLASLAYTVVEGPHATARVQVGTHVLSPQQISAAVLAELRQWAQADLGCPVTRAVITVPAYFDDAQRQATRDAGRLAGLDVRRIVNEPTAAALAYGLGERGAAAATDTKWPSDQVAKWPSGKAKNKKPSSPRTVSLTTKLDPDACASDGPHSATGPLVTGRPSGRLHPSAPSSATPSQTIAVYDLGGGTFDVSILKLQQTESGAVDQVLATDGDTRLGGDDLDRALMERIATSSTSAPTTPADRQALRRGAEDAKIQLSTDDTTDVSVTLNGKAVHATLTRDDLNALADPLIDRTLAACTRALNNAGVNPADLDRVILVGGSTRIPRVRERVAEFFGTTPYTALNPDQVVALGAAVQGATLAGIRRDAVLLDVIPLSLGIETMGGAVAKLIVANTAIPASATERFSTYAEGQTKVKIHVLQGERELVEDCRTLATFDLTGIPPMPAGLPKVVVTFRVDANGILSVQAQEERSGRRAQVQVVPHHGLTRSEVAKMEADAFTHAREDMRRHRLIDLRLNARLDIRNITRQLERLDPTELDPDYRAQVQANVATVQAFVDADDQALDPDAFQAAMEAMDHGTLRLAEINIAKTLRSDTA